MEGKKAKITVEVEGEETEVYETNLFTLIADQGERTVVFSYCKNESLAAMADHIDAIEGKVQKFKDDFPELELLRAVKNQRDRFHKAQKEDSTNAGQANGEV